jgi:hypothetical protein
VLADKRVLFRLFGFIPFTVFSLIDILIVAFLRARFRDLMPRETAGSVRGAPGRHRSS